MTKKAFVKMGELSFSIYLFHLPILLYFSENYERRRPGSLVPTIAIACTLCFIVAVVNFILIENPARRFILGWWKKAQTKSVVLLAPSLHRAGVFQRQKKCGWLEWRERLCFCCVAAVKLDRQFRFAPECTALSIAAASSPESRNVIYGDALVLRGISKTMDKDGVHLVLAWQSLKSQNLDCLNIVELIDRNGVVKGKDDYWQDRAKRAVQHGQIWTDTLDFANADLQGISDIGLKIANVKVGYEVPITAGAAKPGDTRLLLKLN